MNLKPVPTPQLFLISFALAFAAFSITACDEETSPQSELQPIYFPLEQGSMWTYSGDEGGTAEMSIQGTQVVRGVETIVRLQSVDGEMRKTYWTSNAEGDVWLHGETIERTQNSVAYDPPILYLDAPLQVGKTWTTTAQWYGDLEGTVFENGPFPFTFGVVSEKEIVIHGDEFWAYEVGLINPERASLNLGESDDLERYPDSWQRLEDFNDWVSSGVGIVRFFMGQHYDLETFVPNIEHE